MIETVRSVIDEIDDPQLVSDLRGFSGQEAHHAKTQEILNKELEGHGFKMALCRKMYDEHFSYMDGMSAKKRAAVHAAYEHFTSVFCAFSLRNLSMFDDMEKDHRDMMVWHNIEEVEHKSVMYDLFNELEGSYCLRLWGFYKAIIGAFITSSKFQKMMLKDNGCRLNFKDSMMYLSFFWGMNGMGYHCLKNFPKYLRLSFHPTDIDDSDLLENWRDRFPELEFKNNRNVAE